MENGIPRSITDLGIFLLSLPRRRFLPEHFGARAETERGEAAVANLILVVGGSRSGKSEYARRLAESLAGPRLFLATSAPLDEEMRERIAAHRSVRSASLWDTAEVYEDILPFLKKAGRKYSVVLVDCLTLWLSTLMRNEFERGGELTEKEMSARCSDLALFCRQEFGSVLFVSNEVGMGIVPENAVARRFRDLAGRCNQVMAAFADEVFLLTCGLPIRVKGGDSGTPGNGNFTDNSAR